MAAPSELDIRVGTNQCPAKRFQCRRRILVHLRAVCCGELAIVERRQVPAWEDVR